MVCVLLPWVDTVKFQAMKRGLGLSVYSIAVPSPTVQRDAKSDQHPTSSKSAVS